MKTKPYARAFAFALALLLTLSAAPPRVRAVEDPTSVSTVADITATPSSSNTTGHVRFGTVGDIDTLTFHDEDGNPVTARTVEEALKVACSTTLGSNVKLQYISNVSVPAAQGTLYNGYNNEGDTGEGVAGVLRYYTDNADNPTNYRISDIRFVPKTSYSGRAAIDYYGYYSYVVMEPSEIGIETAVTKTGSYTGRLYITVSKQEPGISYSTDGEPVQFASEDFTNYCAAVTGRAFKYVSFRLPRITVGALYYNYISSSIYDYAVASGQHFFRTSIPTVDRVFFVPAENFAGEILIEYTGVDNADAAFTGELRINVTNTGPGHTQPTAEGPFVYQVDAGRPVNLDQKDFDAEVRNQLGTGKEFRFFSLASLPEAASGTLYYDYYYTTASSHAAKVGADYASPDDMRFVANAGYSGVVSVPIVVTAVSGESFDSMLRFVITDKGDKPLRYKVEPERRVSFIASEFSDACYSATGYELGYIVFNNLPSPSTGSLYYNGNTPVTTGTSARYYRSDLGKISFLANAGFTGEVSFSFTGYASGYSSTNGRAFSGTVTIVSTTVVEQTPTIGSASGPLTYSTWGPAVPLNYADLYSRAVSALPGAPATLSLSRPEYGAGQLCLDFISLSSYTAFDASRSYPITDAFRISYLPKAGFSGTARITFTVGDASGNTYTGSISFVVTPPVNSSYFSDMGSTAWAVQAVDFFRLYGATNGTSGNGTRFGPSDNMRRGDFLLLLQRLFVFPSAGMNSYSDVPQDKYYAAAIASAKALGVVTDADAQRATGSASRFNPEDAITREDAALYLYRALRRAGKIEPGSAAALSRFPDAGSVASAAAEAMGALVRDNVFQGYVNNLLPKRTLSRAETMAILYRAFT